MPPTDAYTEYLHKPNKEMNEHDYFAKAKAELQRHHHEKVTKVLKSFRIFPVVSHKLKKKTWAFKLK